MGFGRLFAIVLVVIGLGWTQTVVAETEFTVEEVNQATGKLRARYCVAQDRFREQSASANEGDQFTNIVDLKKGLAWWLYPGKKSYVEKPLKELVWLPYFAEATVISRSKDPQGEERVRGMVCQRFQVTKEKFGLKTTLTVWVSKDIGWPVRVKRETWENGKLDQIVLDYINLKAGPQEPALFLPPSDFSRWQPGR